MDFKVELFNWNDVWEVTGPFIITGIALIVLAIAALIIINKISNRAVREVILVIIGVLIAGVVFYVLIITSDIWGSN